MGSHRLATQLFALLFLPMLAQLKRSTAVSARITRECCIPHQWSRERVMLRILGAYGFH